MFTKTCIQWLLLLTLLSSILCLQLKLIHMIQPIQLHAAFKAQELKVYQTLIPKFHTLIADIYWLRSIQLVMDKEVKEKSLMLYSIFDFITTLDVNFKGPFLLGATFLTMQDQGTAAPDKAIQLLNKAIIHHPHDIAFYTHKSMIYYMDIKDYTKAAETMLEASEQPQAPPNLKFIAGVMYVKGGQIIKARRIFKDFIDYDDEVLQKKSLGLLNYLEALTEIKQLNFLINLYQKNTLRIPDNWQLLIQANLLEKIPSDPTGCVYYLNPNQGQAEIHKDSSLYQFRHWLN